MTTPPTEPFVSEEEAERRTNREALLIIGAGFLFLCVPTILCMPQVGKVTFWTALLTLTMLSALGTLLIYLRVTSTFGYIFRRKRKRFIPADELDKPE